MSTHMEMLNTSPERKLTLSKKAAKIAGALAVFAASSGAIATGKLIDNKYIGAQKTTLIGAQVPLGSQTISEPFRLRAWQFNIHQGEMHGKSNIPAVIHVLQSRDAEAMFLQEVPSEAVGKIVKSMVHYDAVYDPAYTSPYPVHLHGNKLGFKSHGNLTLWRSSLTQSRINDRPEIKFSSRQLIPDKDDLPPRTIDIARIATSSKANLILFNSHFEARNKRVNLQNATSSNGFVSNNVGPEDMVFGCADINNEVGASDSSQALIGDQFQALRPISATFGDIATIDGCFGDKSVHSMNTQVIPTQASDHSAVYMDIIFERHS